MENQTKLQLLAGYLPYGLKFVSSTGKKYAYWSENGAYYGHRTSFGGDSTTFINFNTLLRNYKPILRPLSNLPDSELMRDWGSGHNIKLEYSKKLILAVGSATSVDILGYPLQFITELYKGHWDIHGLIKKGLAINVNDL